MNVTVVIRKKLKTKLFGKSKFSNGSARNEEGRISLNTTHFKHAVVEGKQRELKRKTQTQIQTQTQPTKILYGCNLCGIAVKVFIFRSSVLLSNFIIAINKFLQKFLSIILDANSADNIISKGYFKGVEYLSVACTISTLVAMLSLEQGN